MMHLHAIENEAEVKRVREEHEHPEIVSKYMNSGTRHYERELASTQSIHSFDEVFDQIVPPGTIIEKLAGGFAWAEGPLWLPDQQMLIFSDIDNNRVLSWSNKHGLKTYLRPSGFTGSPARKGQAGSNGLALDHNNHLLLC